MLNASSVLRVRRLSRPMSPMPEFDDDDSPRNSPTRMQTVIQNGDATSTQNGKKCNDITAVTSEDPQENQNAKLEITDNWITKDESNGE